VKGEGAVLFVHKIKEFGGVRAPAVARPELWVKGKKEAVLFVHKILRLHQREILLAERVFLGELWAWTQAWEEVRQRNLHFLQVELFKKLMLTKLRR
jgi:hypothetical protein